MKTIQFAIVWKNARPTARIEVANGKLAGSRAVGNRQVIQITDARTAMGSNQTLVTVRAGQQSFSFFLRDVNQKKPIFLPQFGAAVTASADKRSYSDIAQAIEQHSEKTVLQQIQQEPEESYAQAAEHTQNLTCQTWLGLSRDMRIFALDFRSMSLRWDWIEPKFHGHPVRIHEMGEQALKYYLMIGRGFGCTRQITRQLDDGQLPILHATLLDGGIRYEITAFVALESHPLTARNVRGTHFLVADGHGHGHMFTPKQHEQFSELLSDEINREEETLLCYRVRAVNDSSAPRYAWMYTPNVSGDGHQPKSDALDENGFAKLNSGRVYCVNRLNGQPLPQREIAVLVPARGDAVFEFYIPHQPLFKKRALLLTKLNFDEKLKECRAYWQEKLRSGAQIHLPEKRVNDMTRAGLLHLDLITYGHEPKGTLAATIGVYNPIGSESAPIIQFFDSMGWHSVAERSLQYFLDKQHDDGFIQNFNNYMLETGAALWSMGEHWRYTRDETWLQRVTPQLLKSCDYLIGWREKNKRPELRGCGYGMIDGKVADPDDPFHSFMLNGYAYLGLSRIAEMLAKSNPNHSRRLAREAAALKRDIRASFFAAAALGPVVPLGDGRWASTVPPWAESDRGPSALYAQSGNCYTHGTFFARDSIIGPLYLVNHEVLDAHEPMTQQLLDYHAELMTDRNVGFSQPYYCRHDWIHLLRGDVKAFLKNYYNGFASLADRQTHTFWEHYFGASPHKTHEEAWFLMQTRWMLWLEQGDALHLLPAIPRAWLEVGKNIALKNVASYFGPISLHVQSTTGKIEAHIECRSNRQPKSVVIRLPHPADAKPRRVHGGIYDAVHETVKIKPFHNQAKVTLEF